MSCTSPFLNSKTVLLSSTKMERCTPRNSGYSDLILSRPTAARFFEMAFRIPEMKTEGTTHLRKTACGQMDVAIKEVGVQVVDDLLHCPFGRGDGSVRTSESGHLGLEVGEVPMGIAPLTLPCRWFTNRSYSSSMFSMTDLLKGLLSLTREAEPRAKEAVELWNIGDICQAMFSAVPDVVELNIVVVRRRAGGIWNCELSWMVLDTTSSIFHLVRSTSNRRSRYELLPANRWPYLGIEVADDHRVEGVIFLVELFKLHVKFASSDPACLRLIRIDVHDQVRVDEDNNAAYSPALACFKEKSFIGDVGGVYDWCLLVSLMTPFLTFFACIIRSSAEAFTANLGA
ncbi:unnamed protein product [Heligmosomoides polygyrus]|uniref:START domain-containing protein n=1 Tax=Heligmosomoides polygyrus TaxID=6339 RepID=A0A183GT83_HELPZ|nr:unnamed protein product [Heligmosomoides polygyrus]